MKIHLLEQSKFNIFKRKIGKNKIFITGFHGVGAVGYLVSKYLTLQKESKLSGYIIPKRMPMMIRMENGRIGFPFELYLWNNCIILLNENLPDPREVHNFCKKIADWIIENKFDFAILFGGLAEKVKGNKDIIRIAYTTKFKEKYQLFAPTLENKLAIIGPLALLLSKFEEKKFPAVCILPYAKIYDYDLNAAHTALKILKNQFKLNVDLAQIEKDIITERRMEVSLLQQIEKMKEQTKPPSKIMYM